MTMHAKLIHELTALDRRESTKRGYNPYALPQYFQAANDVTDARTFAQAFNATRGMHRVARNMGWSLEVERGRWVLDGEVI